MTRIAFSCDRCQSAVEGLHSPFATGGFYVVSEGMWSKYGREGEHFVCDTFEHTFSPSLGTNPRPIAGFEVSPHFGKDGAKAE
jgi:hypothetical protein